MELERKQEKTENGIITKKYSKPLTEKLKELRPNEFVRKDSLLTTLWEVTHLRAVCNICIAIFALLYLNIIIIYLFDSEKLSRDFSIVVHEISKFHIFTAICFGMNLSIVFVLYPAFRFWSTTRLEIKKKKLYDMLFCFLYVVYQLASMLIPPIVIVAYNLPPISSLLAVIEQIRLIMKTHAFVRENAARTLYFKSHQDGDREPSRSCPEVGKLIYFLFAPTLIYKDNYARTQGIRWNYVAWSFMQAICCIFIAYIPCMQFIVGMFNKVGIEPLPLVNFMSALGMSIFAGGLLMCLSFYGYLHCWLNAFAEILQYGDRTFYNDWWNSTSFGKFYLSWNSIVSDWLYSYIYKDAYSLLGQNADGTMLVVFMLSSIIHEYALAIAFRFVFPLLFIQFGIFGVLLIFITQNRTSNIWNVFFWACMLQGWGFLTVFYSTEWYARINCPRTLDSWIDYVVPRSFTCSIISLPS